MAGILYIVGTPIGNLSDISERAKATLASVDAILCEDTRVTAKLLQHFDIRTPTISYHEHSDLVKEKEILDRLARGESLALVSDAGTPAISDPGGKLVAAVVRSLPDVVISPVPGPSALIAALSISGFPANDFTFWGFPPQKKGRKKFFKHLAAHESTLVIYESTHRIIKAMEELREEMKDRAMVVCRELTKMHETIYRGDAESILKQLDETSTKGEFVIVIGPKT